MSADIAILAGMPDRNVFDSADDYARETAKLYPGVEVDMTGHSLGGTLAAHAQNSIQAQDKMMGTHLFDRYSTVVFDAAYYPRMFIYDLDDNRVFNVASLADPVTAATRQLDYSFPGSTIYVDTGVDPNEIARQISDGGWAVVDALKKINVVLFVLSEDDKNNIGAVSGAGEYVSGIENAFKYGHSMSMLADTLEEMQNSNNGTLYISDIMAMQNQSAVSLLTLMKDDLILSSTVSLSTYVSYYLHNFGLGDGLEPSYDNLYDTSNIYNPSDSAAVSDYVSYLDFGGIDINAGYTFDNIGYSNSSIGPTVDSYEGITYNGYFDSSTGYYSAGIGFSFPVVLDLNGDGVSITPRDSSLLYGDVLGDGTKHRLSWASAGDGVLAYDYTGTGNIDSPLAFQFTAWDPSASSDMEALADVFDTNQNGQLDPGDAKWSSFKVLVTNPDGTSTTLKSLSELGITSINLHPDNTQSTLSDGTTVLGSTTFSRADGTTGTASDVALTYDKDSYLVHYGFSVGADGAVSIDMTAYNADGSLAKESVSTTSSNGVTRTVKQDQDGDGVFETTQTQTIAIDGYGNRTTTVFDTNVVGARIDRTTTVRSADGKTITIAYDLDGNDIDDKTESRVTDASGTIVTLTDLAPNGTAIDTGVVTTTANGLSKTVKQYLGGSNGTLISTQTDTIGQVNGQRVETILTYAGQDGAAGQAAPHTLVSRDIVTTSADGRTKTTESDLDGNGSTDFTRSNAIVVNANGSSTTTDQTKSNNGKLISKTVTSLSADGLSKTVWEDAYGNGYDNSVTTDNTVLNPDGSTWRTVVINGATQLYWAREEWSADGRTRTINTDANGEGHIDSHETIVVNGDGSTTDTLSALSQNGTLEGRTITTTSADGKTSTVATSLHSNGAVDLTRTTSTITNGDGSVTATVTETNGNGSLRDKTVATTHAGGLSTTTYWDVDGNGLFDRSETDIAVLGSNGSQTETVSDFNANGTLRAKATTTVSANHRVTTETDDLNGDGHDDRISQVEVQDDGMTVTTVSNYNFDQAVGFLGSLKDQTIVSTTADGLQTTTQWNIDGVGDFDSRKSDITTLNANGSKTRTITDLAGDGHTIKDQTVVTTSANGRTTTTQVNRDGTGSFDAVVTDVTAVNADGSTTETISTFNGDQTVLKGKSTVTTSGNGLSITTQQYVTGNSLPDATRTDVTVLNWDSSTTRTISDLSSSGKLTGQTTITTSPTGNIASVRDINGDGHTDQSTSSQIAQDGSTITTSADYAANGGLKDKVVATTSANGLSKTTQWDNNGDGTFDAQQTDVTVLATDGSTARTVTNLAGNGTTVKDRTVVTTSASGLSTSTTWDTNGDGATDLTETDVKVLSADGSQSETLSDYTGTTSGPLKSKRTTTVSADQLTTTVIEDTNGDSHNDKSTVVAIQANGSVVTTSTDLNADGSTKDKAVVTKSASGLSTTTLWYAGSSNTPYQTRTDVTSLNQNGRTVETIQNTSAAHSDTTTIETTANGLSKTTSWTIDGASRSQTDITTLKTDGTTTEVVSYQGNGRQTRYTETTSANGLTVTKLWDADGNGVDDQIKNDVTVVNADGSRTETITATTKDGKILSTSATTTSASGLVTTTVSDTNLDGVTRAPDQTRIDEIAKNADGSSSETVTSYYIDGRVKDRAITTSSADGRTTTVTRDANGDGWADQITTTLVAADGSFVTTTSDYGSNRALLDQATKTVSSDKMTTTTKWDLDGNGTIDRIRTDETKSNADGSRIETITDINADGTPYQNGVLTTSADGRSSFLQKDTLGRGFYDHTEATTVAADGSSQTIIQNINDAAGSPGAKSIVDISADGLIRTLKTDAQGDGVYEYNEQTTTNIDGSRATHAYRTSASGTTIDDTYTWISADGMIKTLQVDANGDGKKDSTEGTTIHIDGSATTTHYDYDTSGQVIATSIVEVSANGESKLIVSSADKTTRSFVNGDGNSVVLNDGTSDAIVSGTSNQIWLNGGSIAVASGSSVTINGSNDTIIAATDATVTTAGSNNQIFRTQADLSLNRRFDAQNQSSVKTDDPYGYTYSKHNGVVRHFYDASRMPGSSQTVHAKNLTTGYYFDTIQGSHIFLNGSQSSFQAVQNGQISSHPYAQVSPGSPQSHLSNWVTSVSINASGYIGTDEDSINNWVTAIGNDPVFISGQWGSRDYLEGGGGNDVIDGAGGSSDVLLGGGGNDTIYFDKDSYDKVGRLPFSDYLGQAVTGQVSQAVDGGDGYDTAVLTTDADANINLATGHFEALIANAGNDTIVGNSSALGYIDGAAGNDTITGGGLADILLGGTGNDTIHAGDGDDLLEGGADDDTLYGEAGADVLQGNDGNDILVGGAGADRLDGGSGSDTASYASDTVSVTVNLQVGTSIGGGAAGDQLINIENLIGGSANDTLTGNAGDNSFKGGAGADIMDGGAGIDTLSYEGSTTAIKVALGEAGVQATSTNTVTTADDFGDKFINFENVIGGNKADTITGNSLDNVLSGGGGADTISGGAGNDTIIGGAGADTMDGGAGIDTLSYEGSTTSINLTLGEAGVQKTSSSILATTDDYGDKYINFENVIGGKKANNITGNSLNNVLIGGAVADTLSGAAGDDLIIGGAGADTLDGGAGIDTLSYAGSTLSVSVTLGAAGAQTTASGATGSDSVGDKLKNFENLVGGLASDTLTGNTSNNVLNGGGGNDTLTGGGGSDTYIFSSGQQTEIIVNGLSSNTGASGELDIAVDHDDLWFVKNGNDLVIDVLGTSEQVTIKDWYKDTSSTSWEQLSKIAAQDGLQLTSAQQVNNLVQAMATFSANYNATSGTAFDPRLAQNATITDAAVIAAQGSAWHA
ncbi:MAG: hypothetical protein J0I31_02735 [Rhizobiales bacterium]|nr:hypothetical protein [Hyphomicrobiales bacterium]